MEKEKRVKKWQKFKNGKDWRGGERKGKEEKKTNVGMKRKTKGEKGPKKEAKRKEKRGKEN